VTEEERVILLNVTALHVGPDIRRYSLAGCGHAARTNGYESRQGSDVSKGIHSLLTDETEIDSHLCKILDGHGTVVLSKEGREW
jgi:hypothetical protein